MAISDGAGNASSINKYDEYGVPASTNVGRFQYTGQAWLPELGLYDYKARMYDPVRARFAQLDPTWPEDGANGYVYVGGDPVNMSDPTGMFTALLQDCDIGCSWALGAPSEEEDERQANPPVPGHFDSTAAQCVEDAESCFISAGQQVWTSVPRDKQGFSYEGVVTVGPLTSSGVSILSGATQIKVVTLGGVRMGSREPRGDVLRTLGSVTIVPSSSSRVPMRPLDRFDAFISRFRPHATVRPLSSYARYVFIIGTETTPTGTRVVIFTK